MGAYNFQVPALLPHAGGDHVAPRSLVEHLTAEPLRTHSNKNLILDI